MFLLTAEDPARKTLVLLKSIAAHLKALQERFEFYFPAANENFDWIRDPFNPLLLESANVANQSARRTGETLYGLHFKIKIWRNVFG